jgi:RimJ/RimL family protein N-acetyltransferase
MSYARRDGHFHARRLRLSQPKLVIKKATTFNQRFSNVQGCARKPAFQLGKSMSNFEIISYQGGRNADVAALILAIQRNDVGLHVPVEEQPELLDIGYAYREGGFWLAEAGGEIVGTVGMMRYGPSGILKKLFVREDYRGPAGASHALHDKAVAWAVTNGLDAIFLDTPSVATRSHAFYQRKGYRVVDRSELPEGYDFPDRDSLIFKLDISRIDCL